MDFQPTERQAYWRDRVKNFIDDHIRPAVPTYKQQDAEGERWKVIPVVEELKAKAKKDPNAPKGKSSAFIFFGSATRAEIKAAHPDWSLGDVGRELGKRWKELSDDDKKPFHDQAAKDAERYKTEMEAYKAKQAADEE